MNNETPAPVTMTLKALHESFRAKLPSMDKVERVAMEGWTCIGWKARDAEILALRQRVEELEANTTSYGYGKSLCCGVPVVLRGEQTAIPGESKCWPECLKCGNRDPFNTGETP